MKLLFQIIIIFIFVYVNGQNNRNDITINGCGKVGYGAPQVPMECKDDFEICCFISIEEKGKESNKRSFCFPAPKKMKLGDVNKEFEANTGFTITNLTCYDFSEKIRLLMGNLLLIVFILF